MNRPRGKSGGTSTREPRGSSPGLSLFEAAAQRSPEAAQNLPLPERLRPRALDEVVGQQHVLGPGKPLAEAVGGGRVTSFILWGPPGSGKTTIARLLAQTTRAHFVPFNAVLGGVADIREIVAEARERRTLGGRGTILFVDEIHRFNKAQQDAFLPHLEDATLVLVGATTDNPSFSLNAPLLSRCVVYRLHALGIEDLKTLLWRAIGHPSGFAGSISAEERAIHFLAALADGDGRRALQVLEVAVEHAKRLGEERLTRRLVESLGTEGAPFADRAGEQHYNVTHAFVSSMRCSDPDAAVYWMMRMVSAGEDPLFVLRRLIVFASEEVGNADPRSLSVAVDADRAFRRLGLPEGLHALSQAVTYLASAPKSNAASLAWQRAREALDDLGALAVPPRLRQSAAALTHDVARTSGVGSSEPNVTRLMEGDSCLPDSLVGARFYRPTTRGLERHIVERLRRVRGEKAGDGGSEED